MNTKLQVSSKIAEFEASRAALQSFVMAHPRLMEQYEQLRSMHNSTLVAAKAEFKKHYKELGLSLGEFKVVEQTVINGKLLLELMPNADAIVELEYKVDRAQYKKLVADNVIPPEVVQQVESKGTAAVYGPKEA